MSARERGVDLLFLSLRLEDPSPIQIKRDVWLIISSILLFIHPSNEVGRGLHQISHSYHLPSSSWLLVLLPSGYPYLQSVHTQFS